ncbi:response regulator transcription factor [Deinococcus lacus]|uniref:Response regulator transcription factor n=1 Tax=Deinococcus lacus TaxID=392561 RepID=A0ABW1YE86_9DEIO
MRLLLAEDDPRIAEPTTAALREGGYAVTWVQRGDEALAEARAGDYSLVVLDVMLPGLSGFEVAAALRAEGHQAAVLFLTARSDVADRVQGLDLGGDAYLTKPFAVPELLATLRALSRRERGLARPTVTFGGQGTLDTVARRVTWAGQEVAVTGREYALLEELALSPGHWMTREELLSRVWGPDFGGEARIVDVYVRYLRRKLSDSAIRSERGRGYRIEAGE